MKHPLAQFLILALAVSAASAAAKVKCISLPQSVLAADAPPGAKFEKALRQTRICADSEAYNLASEAAADQDIAASVVEKCKRHVEDQAEYAVLANLGWTQREVLNREFRVLSAKALDAVVKTKAGRCPVTMAPESYAAKR